MIYYDLETTGLDVLNDRIIEIYALKINGAEQTELHHFVNPGIHIPKEASDIHGYTDDFVKDKPLLKDLIEEIHKFFENETLIGYNVRKFDNIFLDVEFDRYGYDFKIDERKTIDVFELWTIMEPRNLAGALKRFCNETSDNLHSAKEDVNAASKVYTKMLEQFSLSGKSIDEMAAISLKEKNSLCFGKLKVSENKDIIFNFGKYNGKSVREIMQNDYDYLKWMVNKSNMESAVKYYIVREVNRIKNKQ
jgi:DNA polymerase-3 subunit epsilon